VQTAKPWEVRAAYLQEVLGNLEERVRAPTENTERGRSDAEAQYWGSANQKGKDVAGWPHAEPDKHGTELFWQSGSFHPAG
jgi:hypothetical protein